MHAGVLRIFSFPLSFVILNLPPAFGDCKLMNIACLITQYCFCKDYFVVIVYLFVDVNSYLLIFTIAY